MKLFKNKYLVGLVGLLGLTSQTVFAEMDYTDLSLDELMNIKIVESVTKLPEELFKAPVSVSILERDDISKSGAMNIPEALRLVPGVIVREQTPGNFDVNLRGFDNATSNSLIPFPQNAVTLVMIDYRIVYNYFSGGTLWEALPVSMDDIKQIEVIRGPSSALYGPNAVAGVINIVTDKPEEAGWSGRGGYKVGSDNALTTTNNFNYMDDQGITMQFSSQYNRRDRQSDEYYLWNQGAYLGKDSILNKNEDLRTPMTTVLAPDEESPFDEQFTDPELSLENYSAYYRAGYQVNPDLSFEFNTSMQVSQAKKIFINNFATPLTETVSESRHGEVKMIAGATHVSASYLQGEQSVPGQADWQYQFDVIDVLAEHFFQFNSLLIKPTLSYRSAVYNGRFIGGEKDITSQAGALLADYTINSQFRVMSAGRIDRYEHMDDLVYSYQGSFTYSPNFDNVIRTSFYNAKQAPSMIQTHIDHTIQLDLGDVNYLGNPQLVPLEQSTVEIGYRTKSIPMLDLEFEAFYSEMSNLSDLTFDETDDRNTNYRYSNYNLDAAQQGLTMNAIFNPISWAEVRLGGTVQMTEYSDVGSNTLINDDYQTTPSFYGNSSLILNPVSWMTLWTDLYYMDGSTYRGLIGENEIDPIYVLNVTPTFRVHNNVSIQASGRNLLADEQEQYGFTDQLGRYYTLSVQANF